MKRFVHRFVTNLLYLLNIDFKIVRTSFKIRSYRLDDHSAPIRTYRLDDHLMTIFLNC